MITLKLVRHKIKYDNIRICNKNKNTEKKKIPVGYTRKN